MDIGPRLKPAGRKEWRAWLLDRHASEREIWLILDDEPGPEGLIYLDAVEEALCFGWIDGIGKRASGHERAQRFSPRRRGSHWTELNKERARRLIRLGLMHEAGRAVLPDLSSRPEPAADILAALEAAPGALGTFLAFPELYRRIRVGYVEESRRDPEEFRKRLANLVEKSARGKMFGSWDDGGRLG